MSNEMINLCAWAGEPYGEDSIRFQISVTKEVSDKMAEIRDREPEKWPYLSMELVHQASDEVMASHSPELDKSQEQ